VVSIACTITYPKNDDTRAMAVGLPLDALVVETDSPYLPPQFMRGKQNEPLHVRSAVEAIAAARNEPVSRIASATTDTARRVFALSRVPAWS
ncbi:TatD family hydrolase, partial [bacterium]|nr:TatD family hydrolase [bacterium]